MAVQNARRRARQAAVAFIGVASFLSSVGVASATADTAWFRDPVSKANRATEIAIPANPSSVRGALQHTTATARARNGAIAVPAASAAGHTLVSPQAVTFQSAGMFSTGSATLTATGTARITALGASLSATLGVRCEGYVDFGGAAASALTLSSARARAVCAAVRRVRAAVSVSSVGYGNARPVVVGGTSGQRRDNNRVVLVVTKSAPRDVPAPIVLSVFPRDASAIVAFTPVVVTGVKVTGYEVSTDGGTKWSALTTTDGQPTSALISGLTNDVTYPVSVRAVTPAGAGQPSVAIDVTPKATVVLSRGPLPSAPYIDQIGETWTAEWGDTAIIWMFESDYAGDSPITGYEISTDGGAWTELWLGEGVGMAPVPIDPAGPCPQNHSYQIRAVSALGAGEASNSVTYGFSYFCS
ncbi:MAG: hypothetical protein JWM93_981 [Frankiales bacterium]|nr:hypothetical protein [Frankiales bacterium]